MATRKNTRRKARKLKTVVVAAAFTFEGVKTDPQSHVSADWDQARGMVARMTELLLECDDKELERRYAGDAEHAHALMDFSNQLRKEIDYLKLRISMMDTLSARIRAVAHRAPPHWPRREEVRP